MFGQWKGVPATQNIFVLSSTVFTNFYFPDNFPQIICFPALSESIGTSRLTMILETEP